MNQTRLFVHNSFVIYIAVGNFDEIKKTLKRRKEER